jgi:hypothetical protein
VPRFDSLADSTFTEGHELEPKMGKKIPKNFIGRRLPPVEAERLLDILGKA